MTHQEKAALAISQAREILENESFETDAELQASYQRAVDDARKYHQLAKDESEREAIESDLDEQRAKAESFIRPAGDGAPTVVDPLVQAVRDFCAPPVETGPRMRVLELPTSKRADEEWFKDTSKSTKAGYTYGIDNMTEILWHENALSGVLQAGPTFIDTDHGRQLHWPSLATDASAAMTAERTAATLTYPVFGEQVLDSYRMDGYMTLTEELIRDSEVNIMQAVTEVASRALATVIASYLATGTGTSQPKGAFAAAAAGVTAAAKTTFTADEIVSLYLSVLPGSRARGSFVVGSTALGILYALKTADDAYLMHDFVNAPKGAVGTIMGKGVYEDAAGPACTTGLKPVIFGDISQMKVRRIGGVRIERDDGVYFTQFESVVRFAQFMDSDLIGDANSIKCLTLA